MSDPRPEKLTVLLPAALMTALRQQAKAEDRTRTAIVQRALRRELERAGAEPAENARKRA